MTKYYLVQPGWDKIVRDLYGSDAVIREIENLSEPVRHFRTRSDMDQEYRYLQRKLLETESE